jgi:hypothetical protein
MKSKTPLFLLLAGYISSLVVYQIWYYTIWPYSHNEKNIVVVVVGITALYLFLYFLILSNRSLQTPRKSFFLISIVTLLTFFLIPSVYYAGNQFRRGREKIYTEK